MAFRESRFSELLRVCESGAPQALAAGLQESLPLFETLAPFQVCAKCLQLRRQASSSHDHSA